MHEKFTEKCPIIAIICNFSAKKGLECKIFLAL